MHPLFEQSFIVQKILSLLDDRKQKNIQVKEKKPKVRVQLKPFILPTISPKNFLQFVYFLFFVIFGILGQLSFSAKQVSMGLFWWLLAVIPFFILSKGKISFPEHEVVINPPLLRWKKLCLVLASLCIVLVYITLEPNQYTRSSLFFLVGGFLLILFTVIPIRSFYLSCISWLKKPSVPTAWLGVLCITFFGAFFRFYLLDRIPADMWHDITANLENTSGILSGKLIIFSSLNTGAETLFFYLVSAVSLWLGSVSFLADKLTSALVGTVTLIAFYALAKQFTKSVPASLLATAFLAVSTWHIILSRIGWRVSLIPLFTSLFLYFLYRAFCEERRVYWALAGLCLALGIHSYIAFRIAPFMLIGLVILYAIANPAWFKRNLSNIGILIITTALLITPLLHYSLTVEGNQFWQRSSSRLNLETITNTANLLGTLLDNAGKEAMMLHVQGDSVFRQNIPFAPQLDPMMGFLFCVGFLLCIRLLGKKEILGLLGIFILSHAPSFASVAFPAEVPAATRSAMSIPLTFLIIALGIQWLLSIISAPTSKNVLKKVLVYGILLITFIGSSVYAYNQYFIEYAKNLPQENYPFFRSIAEVADATSPDTELFLRSFPYWDERGTIKYLFKDPTRQLAGIAPEDPLTCSTKSNPSAPYYTPSQTIFTKRMYILAGNDTKTLATVQQCFPFGILSSYKNYSGDIPFYTYLISLPIPQTIPPSIEVQ